MPRRPVVKWKQLVRLLLKLGYTFRRQKGSHMIFSIDDPQQGSGMVPVPRHDEMASGTLGEILEIVSIHTGLTMAELIEML